jgi:Lrp/AsnC family transcriptional regulator
MPNSLPSDLDAYDRAILRSLQADASRPLADIAERVGLSTSPCWRRIQRLKAEGYVEREVAVLNAARLGMNALVFVHVKLSAHGRQNLSAFTEAVRRLPEVMECFSLMGDYDFILRVLMPDVQAYERLFFERMSALPGVQELKSSMALSTIKSTTAIDL